MNLIHFINRAASARGDGLEPRLAELLAARVAPAIPPAHIQAEPLAAGRAGPASARILAFPGPAGRRPGTMSQPQRTHEKRR